MSGVSQWKGGLLLLVLASALWGAWTAAEKYSLGGLPVITVLGLTLVAAAGLLWAVLLRQGHTRPTREQLRLLAVLGLLEPTIGYGAIGLGLVHVEAAEAALLSGTEACWVVVLASIVSRRLPTRRAVAGVLLAAVGVAVLGGVHGALGLGKGDMLVLVGAVAAATATIIAGRAVRDMEPLVVTSYQFGFGLLFMLPLLAWEWLINGTVTTPQARPGHWIAALLVCGGGLAVAFLLYNHAITRISVTAAGVLINLVPLFGLAAAVIFLGESLNRWHFLGAALILGGIFLFSEADTEAHELADAEA
jgi:drug/metabolite transporter (DMT)-like permease